MILTLLLVQHVVGHVDVDGMDTSVAFLAALKARFEALRAEGTFPEWK